MKVALVERDAALRRSLQDLLSDLAGFRVYAFAEAQIAFLFLLARPDEVAVVVANEDDTATVGLLRRLEVLPASPMPVVYSGRKLARAATRACARSGQGRARGSRAQLRSRDPEASETPDARASSSRTSSSLT